MRHPSDRILGGVCSGIADFTGLAQKKVRLVALILLLIPSGGVGLPLYVLLWLFLPVGTQAMGEVQPPIIRSSKYRAKQLPSDTGQEPEPRV